MKKSSNGDYISHISDPLGGGEDKYELTRYLQSQGSSTILEVGPGGGQALEKLIALSEGWHRQDRYVVLDADQAVLEQLARRPRIIEWASVKMIRGNALAMPFGDAEFDFVNLSAVVHECSSYEGGREGIEKLASECARVLKVGGVLIYRDPEGVRLEEPEVWQLAEHRARPFFDAFLPRFLDTEFTETKKPRFYCCEDIHVTLNRRRLSYREYFFGSLAALEPGTITVEAPAGLIREIQRHFITLILS